MARPLRIEYPGAWYHVMNRGRNKEKIFFDKGDYKIFLDLLGRLLDLFEVETHSYFLMPNHYHLLVHTPRGNLSRALRHLDGVYTQKLNRKYKQDGSLFRGRFKSILIEVESYLLELVRYIHQNPRKAGLEKKLGDHPWTSHRAYLKDSKAPQWLKRDVILEQFSRKPRQAKVLLHEYVTQSGEASLKKRLDSPNWPALLGSDTFKQWIKKNFLDSKTHEKEIPQLKEALRSFTVSDLIEAVSKAGGCGRDALLQVRRGRNNSVRRAFVYLARESLRLKLQDIAQQLGGLSCSAISKQHRIALEEINNKKGCYSLVRKLTKQLKCQVKT